jgi:hypothetical protein
MQLRNCVAAASMTEHVDFAAQVSVSGSEGRQRPDLVVHLPAERDIVADARSALAGLDTPAKLIVAPEVADPPAPGTVDRPPAQAA